MRQRFALGVVLCTIGSLGGAAQPDPQTQPLLQPAAFTYLGEFTVPSDDGTCDEKTRKGCLTYAGYGLTIGPNHTLNIGCHDWTDQVAQISIPALGERASIVQRCQSLTNLSSIDPGDAGNGFTIGGILDYNGRKIISAWSYYDADGSATKSHWAVSPTFTNQQGPVQVGTRGAGFVAGQMTLIPTEWRALFGGPALTGLCCPSIVGRSSWGPAAFVFDPDQVGKVQPVPATPILYYEESRLLAKLARNEMFNFTTMVRGVSWIDGSRTVVFVGKHGTGPYCYGPSAGPNASCPSDPGNQTEHNSYHGYPYRHQIWLYDANDLLLVKQRKKRPWDPKPYATGVLKGITDTNATISGATYDPSTRRLYLTTEYGENPKVHVFAVAAAEAPPPM